MYRWSGLTRPLEVGVGAGPQTRSMCILSKALNWPNTGKQSHVNQQPSLFLVELKKGLTY